MQTKYMMGRGLDDQRYHVATVRTPLTRSLVDRFSDIRDEISECFKDYIPPTKGELLVMKKCIDHSNSCFHLTDWTPVHLYGTLVHIVCRTSNRLFVGLPMCMLLPTSFVSIPEFYQPGRHSGYLAVNEKFARDVTVGGNIINLFPSFLRP
jgi:hypothetical protein